MEKRKVVATLSSVALAVSLMPLPAFAGEALSVGNVAADQSASQQLQPQAAKTKVMYVLTSTTQKSVQENSPGKKITSLTTTNYSYNKNSLLAASQSKSKSSYAGQSPSQPLTKYSYNGLNVRKTVFSAGFTASTSFSLNKKGKRTGSETIYTGISSDRETEAYAYDKNRRLSKCTSKLFWTDAFGNSDSETAVYTFKYDKKGRVSKKRVGRTTMTYTYDANGNIVKTRQLVQNLNTPKNDTRNDSTKKYRNVYKNGLLVSRSWVDDSLSNSPNYTRTYKYKKVRVKATAAKAIEAQQWSLLNEDLNYVLGRVA